MPTDDYCIAREWLTNLGFSTVLSAVLVKMSTINRIMQKSKKCKRVKVSRKSMFLSLSILVVIELVALLTWTLVSPPQAQEIKVLPDELEPEVELSVKCKSENRLFIYIIYIWHLLLLIVASVLSFQSRDIVPAFNESRSIGTMIYSNFLFMILRCIVFALSENDLIQPNIYGASMTLLYVLDTSIAMVIYIIPKIFEARKDTANHVSRGSAVLRSSNGVSASGFSAQLSAGFSSSSINNDSTH